MMRALPLLLCVAVVVMWVRSGRTPDWVEWQTSCTRPANTTPGAPRKTSTPAEELPTPG